MKDLSELLDELAQEAGFADWINITSGDLEQHETDEIQKNLYQIACQRLYAELQSFNEAEILLKFMTRFLATSEAVAKVDIANYLASDEYLDN